jgi:hypothetical protein
VWRSSVRVRRSSVGSALACCKTGPSSTVFSALCLREVFPTELTGDEEMERNLSKWRWMNVWYCMNVMK